MFEWVEALKDERAGQVSLILAEGVVCRTNHVTTRKVVQALAAYLVSYAPPPPPSRITSPSDTVHLMIICCCLLMETPTICVNTSRKVDLEP